MEVSEAMKRYAVVYAQGPSSVGVYVPDLHGCFAVGETAEEAGRLIREAIVFHIEGLRERGEEIPEASSSFEYVDVAV